MLRSSGMGTLCYWSFNKKVERRELRKMTKIPYITSLDELIGLLQKAGIEVDPNEILHPFPILYPRKYVEQLLARAKTSKEKAQIRNLLLSHKDGEVHDEAVSQYIVIPENQGNRNRALPRGLTRMYVDRVLISPMGICAVNCTWCFRKRQKGMLQEDEIERTIQYIEKDERIEDVILTGGEALLFPRKRLASLLRRLREIKHIKIIRFHTRLPVVAPEYMDEGFIQMLGEYNEPGRPIYMVVQVVHPLEIDEELQRLIYKILRQGIMVLNQAPVLRGVNDDQETFDRWNKALIHTGIKPYYVIVPIIKRGYNDVYYVPYSNIVSLVAEYSSKYDGLGRPTVIVPVMGRKMSPIQLRKAMEKMQGVYFRNTKQEIWI